jgi:Domain of Unknown Function (DUF928)
MKRHVWKTIIYLMVGLAIALFIVLPFPGFAHVPSQPTSKNLVRAAINFFRPGNYRPSGAPRGRPRGGGTRLDLCPMRIPLVALIPSVTNSGATHLDNPTLWFYVPYDATMPNFEESKPLELVLVNEQEEEFYKSTVPLPQRAGIVGVPVTRALEVDQTYHWVFSVICEAENRSGDVTVNGWIQRVDPKLIEDQLISIEGLSGREKLETLVGIYADSNNDLWYDLITTLAQLRCEYPEDTSLQEFWTGLMELEAVDLGAIASEPLNCPALP